MVAKWRVILLFTEGKRQATTYQRREKGVSINRRSLLNEYDASSVYISIASCRVSVRRMWTSSKNKRQNNRKSSRQKKKKGRKHSRRLEVVDAPLGLLQNKIGDGHNNGRDSRMKSACGMRHVSHEKRRQEESMRTN